MLSQVLKNELVKMKVRCGEIVAAVDLLLEADGLFQQAAKLPKPKRRPAVRKVDRAYPLRGAARAKAKELILQLLSKSKGPLRLWVIVKQVRRTVPTSRHVVFSLLKELCREGKVRRPSKGYYTT